MYSGEHAEERVSFGKAALSLVSMVIGVLLFSWLLREFAIKAYEIPTGSMESTIEIGDMVFSEKVTYYFRDVQPGDIVTFADPETEGRMLVKRVIAVGGQTVDLVDGKVLVDGVPLDEPYTQGKPSEPLLFGGGENIKYPFTVPEGHVWMMGDNRTNSRDSRVYGPVSVESIDGRGVLTYWPLSHFGLLE